MSAVCVVASSGAAAHRVTCFFPQVFLENSWLRRVVSMALSRFEYVNVGMASVESLTTVPLWVTWAHIKEWRPLPPLQQLRHRRRDGALFMGDGYVSIRYVQLEHPNLSLMPCYRMHLGLF